MHNTILFPRVYTFFSPLSYSSPNPNHCATLPTEDICSVPQLFFGLLVFLYSWFLLYHIWVRSFSDPLLLINFTQHNILQIHINRNTLNYIIFSYSWIMFHHIYAYIYIPQFLNHSSILRHIIYLQILVIVNCTKTNKGV